MTKMYIQSTTTLSVAYYTLLTAAPCVRAVTVSFIIVSMYLTLLMLTLYNNSYEEVHI